MKLVIVANEKGGCRKTAVTTMIADAALASGQPVQIFQVDRQGRLPVLFPGLVATIAMPSTETLRQDDLADAVALAPLDDALRDSASRLVLVEIGANLPSRVADCIAAAETGTFLAQSGTEVTIVVPTTTDPEAITLGCRTLRQLREAFPGARALVCLCQDGASWEEITNSKAREAYDEQLSPLITAGEFFRLPRLLPRALAALDASALTPLGFARLSDTDLLAVTHLPGAVARHVRGDIAKYVYDAVASLQKVLPFRDASEVGSAPARRSRSAPTRRGVDDGEK
ncbi:MAG TPA: hypothetical protein VIF40_11960 [Methylosinus sp.]|jgi:hypothetical protein|uniref:hypothetical protein n=1 Tax=Methylosinus sp. TaxID=427 RepID=UPI002F931BB8